jgi:hypothetical protein
MEKANVNTNGSGNVKREFVLGKGRNVTYSPSHPCTTATLSRRQRCRLPLTKKASTLTCCEHGGGQPANTK